MWLWQELTCTLMGYLVLQSQVEYVHPLGPVAKSREDTSGKGRDLFILASSYTTFRQLLFPCGNVSPDGKRAGADCTVAPLYTLGTYSVDHRN